MPFEHDIVKRIHEDFPPQDADAAVALLENSGNAGRVARCIVFAAGGSLEKLRGNIQLAAFDYRDAIMAGEYDTSQRLLRDLSVSFLVDAPVKFWVSSIARTMLVRGYLLESLETVPTGKAVVRYYSEMGEGTAVFAGDSGKITVTKKQGLWRLHGEKTELELYNLAEDFTDEQRFCDAVSCYILAKQNPPVKKG